MNKNEAAEIINKTLSELDIDKLGELDVDKITYIIKEKKGIM